MAQNYLNAFAGPDLAQIDRAAYGNALMRNDVQRLPQQNRAQDLALQGAELEIGDAQKKAAAGVLGRSFSLLAQSQRPKQDAQAFLSSPDFLAAGKMLGVPVEQFTVTAQDTDDAIRQQSEAWARAFGGVPSRLENADIPSNVRVAEYYAGLPESGPGVTRGMFNEANRAPQIFQAGGVPNVYQPGGAPRPLSTPEAENQAAAGKAAATAQAQANVESQTRQVANTQALGVWSTVKQQLSDAMTGTYTGPIMGLMPAVTAGQQTAEAAIAMGAPVLKQFFRQAGEGNFTDRDQELLIAMLPTRADHPETRSWKLQAIDAIIQAKLGRAQSAAGGNPKPISEMTDAELEAELRAMGGSR